MWLWKGFLFCVEKNNINVSKKSAKGLTVCHNRDFSPKTPSELMIEDMLLTKNNPFLLSFLPSCKFCMYIKQSGRSICCLHCKFHCWANYT